MADVLESGGPPRRVPLPVAVAVVAAAVLAGGLVTAQRLARVDVSVTEGIGGAVRTQSRQVEGDVQLLVRNHGPLPVRVERAALEVRGVAAVARVRGGAVDVRFVIRDCAVAGAEGVLRLRVRPEHGLSHDVDVPVSVDGRDGSANVGTLLGFCAPPFSRPS